MTARYGAVSGLLLMWLDFAKGIALVCATAIRMHGLRGPQRLSRAQAMWAERRRSDKQRSDRYETVDGDAGVGHCVLFLPRRLAIIGIRVIWSHTTKAFVLRAYETS